MNGLREYVKLEALPLPFEQNVGDASLSGEQQNFAAGCIFGIAIASSIPFIRGIKTSESNNPVETRSLFPERSIHHK